MLLAALELYLMANALFSRPVLCCRFILYQIPKPKERDLLRAFETADTDGSGVVDLNEFTELYAKVKNGEIKGLGFSLFGMFLR